MLRTISKNFLQKFLQSPNITKTYKFSTSLPTSTNYPYLFNGLNISLLKQNNLTRAYIKQLFGNDTFHGFKQAYKFILYSLANNDKKSLQNILQKNLTKAMDINKKVQLINQNSQVQIVCRRSVIAFGVRFAREGQVIDLKNMFKDSDNILSINFGIMTNPSIMQTYKKQGMPVLLSFQIFFLSQMRLIQSSSSFLRLQKQLHSVQFQVQGKIELAKYAQKSKQYLMNGMKDLTVDMMKGILLDMIGKDFQWKVGDIDRVLKGNIKLQ